MAQRDIFSNLSQLVLTPEQVAAAQEAAAVKSAVKRARRQQRPRIKGEFVLCPVAWFDQAVIALSSKEQLVAALRIFRRWRTRQPGEETIVVSNVVVAGPGFSREAKRQAVGRLAAAGLLQVVERRSGQSPRVRIMED